MEILVIFILTLLNGFFALSEIALVSVKKSRIEHLAAQGSSRAKIILGLLENPENFLSSVQVGITLIGIVSGAYGGAALTDDLEVHLAKIAFLQNHAHNVSLVIVIGSITYFTIVIGELVPKTIAMNNAEGIALVCAPIIKYFTYATYPFVKLLSLSTNLIVKVFGIKENESDRVSEEELRFMLKTAGKQGVLETEESQVHDNLFAFTDQTAKSLMTHSSDVEWVNILEDKQTIFTQLKESVHSKFMVSEHTMDQVKGVIHIKDFLENFTRENFRLEDILQQPIFVTESTPAFRVLNLFKINKQYLGVVIDEYGEVKGILTLHDLIEALVGDLPDEDEADQAYITKRADGSYLLDGRTLVYELNQYFKQEIIEDKISQYSTVAGFFLDKLKDMPKVGDKIQHDRHQFEIVDMDGLRIDKLLMSNKPEEPNPEA